MLLESEQLSKLSNIFFEYSVFASAVKNYIVSEKRYEYWDLRSSGMLRGLSW